LHLTAALPVLFQWLVGGGLVWRKHHRLQLRNEPTVQSLATANRSMGFAMAWTIAAVGVGLALLPLLQLALPVWRRRTQWATFASDVSLVKALSMFPFVPVLLCVFIGCVVDRLWRGKEIAPQISTDDRWLWWSAMLGPWLTAWSLTAAGIAPMFFSRYVFASALPLFVVGAIELLRCRHSATRWVTSLAVAVAIVFSQGSVSVWRAGHLVGNLRGEDWRAATQGVSERIKPSELLLCSSGLVEANSNSTYPLDLPLDAGFAEYLSFPLLGVYRVADASGQSVPVTPLLGDHRQWAAQVIERLAEGPARPERLWLIYRGAPGRLKTKLHEFFADLRLKGITLEASEPTRFGNLYVVELNADYSTRSVSF
jgi:hypothetical protein